MRPRTQFTRYSTHYSSLQGALQVQYCSAVRTCMVRIKKDATICKICVPLYVFDKKSVALLCFASGFVGQARGTVLRHLLPNAPQFLPNAPQFGETRRIFTRKAPQSKDLRCFTRWRTFRNSVKVRCTQRDKHCARYATLITAALARLLYLFAC